LGPTHVVTPFHHLSGDSHHHHPLLGAGPITASRFAHVEFFAFWPLSRIGRVHL